MTHPHAHHGLCGNSEQPRSRRDMLRACCAGFGQTAMMALLAQELMLGKARADVRLQRVLTKFEASFGRVSLAAKGGFGTAAMGDPLWADGALCGVDVGPFECEIWVSRASVAATIRPYDPKLKEPLCSEG